MKSCKRSRLRNESAENTLNIYSTDLNQRSNKRGRGGNKKWKSWSRGKRRQLTPPLQPGGRIAFISVPAQCTWLSWIMHKVEFFFSFSFILRQHITCNYGYKREPLFFTLIGNCTNFKFRIQNFMFIPHFFPLWFLGATPLLPTLQSWLLWRTFLSTQNCYG